MREKKPKYLNPEARAAAYYFGAECAANPGSTFGEYAEDCALKYGKSAWRDLTQEEKNEARSAFLEGGRAERALQR